MSCYWSSSLWRLLFVLLRMVPMVWTVLNAVTAVMLMDVTTLLVTATAWLVGLVRPKNNVLLAEFPMHCLITFWKITVYQKQSTVFHYILPVLNYIILHHCVCIIVSSPRNARPMYLPKPWVEPVRSFLCLFFNWVEWCLTHRSWLDLSGAPTSNFHCLLSLALSSGFFNWAPWLAPCQQWYLHLLPLWVWS